MPHAICRTCGHRYTHLDTQTAYHFSSVTKNRGDYTSAAQIIILDEPIMTCPYDGDPEPDAFGRTPDGAIMIDRASDNRATEGDETHPSRHEV